MFRELLEMRYLGHVPHALVGSRLTQAVGPLPKTPLPQAVRQAVADLALA